MQAARTLSVSKAWNMAAAKVSSCSRDSFNVSASSARTHTARKMSTVNPNPSATSLNASQSARTVSRDTSRQAIDAGQQKCVGSAPKRHARTVEERLGLRDVMRLAKLLSHRRSKECRSTAEPGGARSDAMPQRECAVVPQTPAHRHCAALGLVDQLCKRPLASRMTRYIRSLLKRLRSHNSAADKQRTVSGYRNFWSQQGGAQHAIGEWQSGGVARAQRGAEGAEGRQGGEGGSIGSDQLPSCG